MRLEGKNKQNLISQSLADCMAYTVLVLVPNVERAEEESKYSMPSVLTD